jgi:hypothetical protein
LTSPLPLRTPASSLSIHPEPAPVRSTIAGDSQKP